MLDIAPVPRPPDIAELSPEARTFEKIELLLSDNSRLIPQQPGGCTRVVRYAVWADEATGFRYGASQCARWARPGTWDNFATLRVYSQGELYAMFEVSEYACYPVGELEGAADFGGDSESRACNLEKIVDKQHAKPHESVTGQDEQVVLADVRQDSVG